MAIRVPKTEAVAALSAVLAQADTDARTAMAALTTALAKCDTDAKDALAAFISSQAGVDAAEQADAAALHAALTAASTDTATHIASLNSAITAVDTSAKASLAAMGTALTATTTKANAAYVKPAAGIPVADLAIETFGPTPYAVNQRASATFSNKRVYRMVWSGKTIASNDSDGKYFTIPNFSKLIDLHGLVVNSVSMTRMPIPTYHNGGWISVRVTNSGDVWIRAVASTGDYNNVDIFIFVDYLQV